MTASYNDLDSVKRLFTQYPDQIAAVIVEPIAGNMGLVPPAEGFLQGLREITKEYGALLIFDEVISGFRASYPYQSLPYVPFLSTVPHPQSS